MRSKNSLVRPFLNWMQTQTHKSFCVTQIRNFAFLRPKLTTITITDTMGILKSCVRTLEHTWFPPIFCGFSLTFDTITSTVDSYYTSDIYNFPPVIYCLGCFRYVLFSAIIGVASPLLLFENSKCGNKKNINCLSLISPLVNGAIKISKDIT